MRSFSIKAMQTDRPDEGRLKIHVTAASGGTPISGARITVSYTGEPDRQLEEVTTDSSGNTEELELAAPPLEYSIEPSEEQPYSEYTPVSYTHLDVYKRQPVRPALCGISL